MDRPLGSGSQIEDRIESPLPGVSPGKTRIETRAASAPADVALDVELLHVSKNYGTVKAVSDVTLKVARGQFYSLLGPSGSGKSTILRLVGGFENCDSGTIFVGGRDVTSVPPFRRPTAMVFQHWALFPHMSVFENVAFGLKMRRLSRAQIQSRVDELLTLVGLEGLGQRKSTKLSGGQQQRVALARALAIQPRVLLLDEPLGSLDLKLRLQMQLELKRLQREVGTTFMYVTHDQKEAMVMSDVVAVVNGGQILQSGAPRDIYDHPTSRFVANFIGDANMLPATTVRVGSSIMLKVGFRTFVPPAGVQLQEGANVTLSLRYERVQLNNPALTNSFEARITDVVFGGSVIHYGVTSDTGDVKLVVEVQHDGTAAVLSEGSALRVGWHPDAAALVAD